MTKFQLWKKCLFPAIRIVSVIYLLGFAAFSELFRFAIFESLGGWVFPCSIGVLFFGYEEIRDLRSFFRIYMNSREPVPPASHAESEDAG